MRIHGRLWLWGPIALAALLAVVWVTPSPPVPASPAYGQDKSKSKKAGKTNRNKPLGNTKALDTQAEQVQAAFTRDAEELAGKYNDAGYPEKAKKLLESVQAVNPDAPDIQKKIEHVKEGILTSNEFEVEVNAAQGWTPSALSVVEKRPLRIKADGTYRFETGASGMTAAGFSEKNPAEDMIAGAPCGALVGVIVADDKPGKPFLIGELVENFTPKESGMLMLRINAPPGNRNSGKIRITVSGNVQSAK